MIVPILRVALLAMGIMDSACFPHSNMGTDFGRGWRQSKLFGVETILGRVVVLTAVKF
jgi:hypothetical protein